MNFDKARKIADSVLYEGYILYPYRASAVKNRQRFNFGTLYPREYSEAAGGAEPWSMRTECLVAGERPTIDVHVRFLHLRARDVFRLTTPARDLPLDELDGQLATAGEFVDRVRIGDQTFAAWQEATERDVTMMRVDVAAVREPMRICFDFSPARECEALRDQAGDVVAMFVRRQSALQGALELSAVPVGERLFQLSVTISNGASKSDGDTVLLRSFVSTHTLLGAADGEFISLLDPPDDMHAAAAACHNVGTWPVLAGDPGSHDMLLSSPIILYDYPQVAPESSGDFFDGTEIDEMLALRVMTLTDDERQEMRGVDARAARILERVETLPAEHFLKLHGAIRSLKGASP